MLPTAEAFADAVRRVGIGADDRVVVYDTLGVVSAARVWWTFRAFGHDAVAVLERRFPKWKARGRRRGRRGASPSAAPFSGAGPALGAPRGMRDNLTTRREQVLDGARRAASRPPSRSRAPGCAAVTSRQPQPGFDTLLRPDGTLLPAAELRRIEAAGVDSRGRVATTWARASPLGARLRLHVLGPPRVAVYDGSWTEWGGAHGHAREP